MKKHIGIALNSKKEMFAICGRYYGDSVVNIVYGLTPEGKVMWQYEPQVDQTLMNSKIMVDIKDNIVLTFGYRNKQTYMSSTEIVKLNKLGKLVKQETIENIKSNGAVALKNGNYLVYGANFQPYEQRIIISKGAYKILNADLKEILSEELNITDEPDLSLSPEAMQEKNIIKTNRMMFFKSIFNS